MKYCNLKNFAIEIKDIACRKKIEKGYNIVENRIINYNFSPLLQGLSKINTITILMDEIIKQHIQNWLAIFHTGFQYKEKQFASQPVRNMPAGSLWCIIRETNGN